MTSEASAFAGPARASITSRGLMGGMAFSRVRVEQTDASVSIFNGRPPWWHRPARSGYTAAMIPAIFRRTPPASSRENLSGAPTDRHRSAPRAAAATLAVFWIAGLALLLILLPTVRDLAFDAAPRAMLDVAFATLRGCAVVLAVALGSTMQPREHTSLALAERLALGGAGVLGLGLVAQLTLGALGVAPALAHGAATLGAMGQLLVVLPLSAALARWLGAPGAVVAAAAIAAVGSLHPLIREIAALGPTTGPSWLIALTPDLDRIGLHGVAAHGEPFPWLVPPYALAWSFAVVALFLLAHRRGAR